MVTKTKRYDKVRKNNFIN